MGDVSKGAAGINMATAKLGWEGEIVLRRLPNFRRSAKVLLNRHPGFAGSILTTWEDKLQHSRNLGTTF